MPQSPWWTWSLLGVGAVAAAVAGASVWLVLRFLVAWFVRRWLAVLLSEPLGRSLGGLYASLLSVTPADVLYVNQRAERGLTVLRPMGSQRPRHSWD
ncbi:MAG: hypothetical protein IRY95_02665, partial [Clostridia bacterium]|nr:hypothetical protein [Clostridia bacterium]